jgi:exodeoxyribonuclease VII small subunit
MTGQEGNAGTPAPIPDSYEKARDELAAVVAALEEGGLTLDQSLALWERGQALAAACERFLAGARERVQAALAAESAEGDGPTDGG